MIIENNNLGYNSSKLIYVEDFQNLTEYSSYMEPNNIIVGSYEYNLFKDYRKYAGYSYEMYYLDDNSNIHQMTYNIKEGNGLTIDENGLVSINIDNYTIQNSENGLVVNTENLNTAYSYYQRGLIKGDNKLYRNFLSEYNDSGFIETRDGIVSLNQGFVHDLLEIKNIEDNIDAEIVNIDDMLESMFKSKKYAIGDLLYYDFNSKQLVDNENTNTIPYMICVIASDTTDDKIPRFIRLEDKTYRYPVTKFSEEQNGLEGLNSYTYVPIFEVPWSKIKSNSNIIFGSYGFIALDREDWYENFVNHFNYDEHYYCNAKETFTEWYLDASFISYNNPSYDDWTVLAGGFYTFNLSDEVKNNVTTFEDLTDYICIKYNNIIKHYKVDFKYDKKNNKYVSVTDSVPIAGNSGKYVLSEKSISMNITWSNILKNPYNIDISTYSEDPNTLLSYTLNSAFIPYREDYDYANAKLYKKYITCTQNNLDKLQKSVSYYDWEWKQDIKYYYKNGNSEYTEITDYSSIQGKCTDTYIYFNNYLIDKTGVPNIGLMVEYTWKYNDNITYKINYEYLIFKSLYESYKFTSKDVNYTSKNKSIEYYTKSEDYITRLYDSENHFTNWESTYYNILCIPNCIYELSSSLKPKVKLTAYNLNDLNPENDSGNPRGCEIGEYNLMEKVFYDSIGHLNGSYLYYNFSQNNYTEITSSQSGFSQNSIISNKIIKELRDYRLAIEGPVYFKPDITYITVQQTENEYLLHDTYRGHIINNILDYRSTFIDYYLYANNADYSKTTGDCNLLSTGCIWLYDPYKILYIYENQEVLISLNIYSINEEISVENKLFKFKIDHTSGSVSYMQPDWYDGNISDYLIHCEQKDIDRITFNYAIDYTFYSTNKKVMELDDVPLAPEGTVIYIPVKEETNEENTIIDTDTGTGGGGGGGEPENVEPDIPATCAEMWIVNDYAEYTATADKHVFLHDMSIGIKFKETNWGYGMVNGYKRSLKLGSNGNIYILYFQMQYDESIYSESNGQSILAFTYRNYSDSKGYVLKLCVNETLMANKHSNDIINGGSASWAADTNASIPNSRNSDLLDFNLDSKDIKTFFKDNKLKFKLIGIGLITNETQLSRAIVPVKDGKYGIGTYYDHDPYIDKKSKINMTERVTVFNAFRYYMNFGERPILNHFASTWPSDGSVKPEPNSSGETVTLSGMYTLKTTNGKTDLVYKPDGDSGNIHNNDSKIHSAGKNISNYSTLCEEQQPEPPDTTPQSWICEGCGETNSGNVTNCYNCGCPSTGLPSFITGDDGNIYYYPAQPQPTDGEYESKQIERYEHIYTAWIKKEISSYEQNMMNNITNISSALTDGLNNIMNAIATLSGAILPPRIEATVSETDTTMYTIECIKPSGVGDNYKAYLWDGDNGEPDISQITIENGQITSTGNWYETSFEKTISRTATIYAIGYISERRYSSIVSKTIIINNGNDNGNNEGGEGGAHSGNDNPQPEGGEIFVP